MGKNSNDSRFQNFQKNVMGQLTDDKSKEKIILKDDSDIPFECQQCGNCCDDLDLILTPTDLYDISDALKIPCIDVMQKYCNYYPGPSSGLPMFLLKSISNGLCSFLDRKTGNCSIHAHRPKICRLYPCGVFLSQDTKTGKSENGYFLPKENLKCAGANCGKTIKFKDFKKKQGLDRYEDSLWNTKTIEWVTKYNLGEEVKKDPSVYEGMMSLILSVPDGVKGYLKMSEDSSKLAKMYAGKDNIDLSNFVCNYLDVFLKMYFDDKSKIKSVMEESKKAAKNNSDKKV